MKIKLWAILDIQKEGEERFCYADENKTKGAMAIYDKKPKVPELWKSSKKVVRVTVETES